MFYDNNIKGNDKKQIFKFLHKEYSGIAKVFCQKSNQLKIQ